MSVREGEERSQRQRRWEASESWELDFAGIANDGMKFGRRTHIRPGGLTPATVARCYIARECFALLYRLFRELRGRCHIALHY